MLGEKLRKPASIALATDMERADPQACAGLGNCDSRVARSLKPFFSCFSNRCRNLLVTCSISSSSDLASMFPSSCGSGGRLRRRPSIWGWGCCWFPVRWQMDRKTFWISVPSSHRRRPAVLPSCPPCVPYVGGVMMHMSTRPASCPAAGPRGGPNQGWVGGAQKTEGKLES